MRRTPRLVVTTTVAAALAVTGLALPSVTGATAAAKHGDRAVLREYVEGHLEVDGGDGRPGHRPGVGQRRR